MLIFVKEWSFCFIFDHFSQQPQRLGVRIVAGDDGHYLSILREVIVLLGRPIECADFLPCVFVPRQRGGLFFTLFILRHFELLV